MTVRRLVKSIHLGGTLWFGLCVTYLLVIALRRVGVAWWTIFSLSASSLAIGFVLVSLYLYALYRGATQDKATMLEHPLTSTLSYLGFYYVSPFLGGLGAALGMAGTLDAGDFVLGVALGTAGATFGVWIVLDPVLAAAEGLLPASRRYRRRRMANQRAQRRSQERERAVLLEQLEVAEESQRIERAKVLEPLLLRLLALLDVAEGGQPTNRPEVVSLGLEAWRVGGLAAMQQLHEMVLRAYEERHGQLPRVDYVAQWWDAVGAWQAPAYLQEGRL